MADRYDIRLPAIRIRQGSHFIYCFGVDGKRIHDFAAVSRVHRDDDSLQGYQRPEVLTHIKAIRRYLESAGAMLPNAVVLAFDQRVTFEPGPADPNLDYIVTGQLVIPVDESLAEEDRAAWLVDGQQRSAAIRDADVAEFPVAAVGFIAKDEAEQRSQFILVNNTKPLPKGLIHELLPDSTGHLPPAYARRRLPAEVMIKLNSGPRAWVGHPFAGRIATPTQPDGYIKDNSVLKMIENSLSDGALYRFRSDDGTGDVAGILEHLNLFWTAVTNVFHEAWDLEPRKSRLTHGVGIQAMGYVMDQMTEDRDLSVEGTGKIEERLRALRSHCAWTSGVWRMSPTEERRWNSLQNTPNDVRLLTSHLLRALRT